VVTPRTEAALGDAVGARFSERESFSIACYAPRARIIFWRHS